MQTSEYSLSELTADGYEQIGNWSCEGGSLIGNVVTLTEGEDVVCTIENDDLAPTLQLVKTSNKR